jgi:large conductance mechanosensitive channel
MSLGDEEVLVELRRIRVLLEDKPPPPVPKGLGPEFRAFLSEHKVLGLSVAFILAIYVGALVQALVKDMILPVISRLTGTSWEAFVVGPFLIGDFAGASLTFLIVLFVIFIIVKLSKRYKME